MKIIVISFCLYEWHKEKMEKENPRRWNDKKIPVRGKIHQHIDKISQAEKNHR